MQVDIDEPVEIHIHLVNVSSEHQRDAGEEGVYDVDQEYLAEPIRECGNRDVVMKTCTQQDCDPVSVARVHGFDQEIACLCEVRSPLRRKTAVPRSDANAGPKRVAEARIHRSEQILKDFGDHGLEAPHEAR